MISMDRSENDLKMHAQVDFRRNHTHNNNLPSNSHLENQVS